MANGNKYLIPEGDINADQYYASIAAQKDALAKSEQDAQLRRQVLGEQAQQLDLSPLLALSDTWYGGKQAQSYQKPMTTAELIAANQGIDKGLQAQRQGITDAELDLLKQGLAYKNQSKAEERQAARFAQEMTLMQFRENKKEERQAAQFAQQEAMQKLKRDAEMGDLKAANIMKFDKEVLKEVRPMLSRLEIFKDNIDQNIAVSESGNFNLPGIGISGALPDLIVGQQGRFIRQNAKLILDDYIKAMSGLGVTDAEARRKAKNFGLDSTTDDAQLIRGFVDLQKSVYDTIQDSARAKGLSIEDLAAKGIRIDRFDPYKNPPVPEKFLKKTYPEFLKRREEAMKGNSAPPLVSAPQSAETSSPAIPSLDAMKAEMGRRKKAKGE